MEELQNAYGRARNPKQAAKFQEEYLYEEKQFENDELKFKQWYDRNHNNVYELGTLTGDKKLNPLPKKFHFETVPALEAMLYEPAPVLDHGFVRVIDYMGSDAAIVQAARVSYGAGTKTVNEDEGLIRYLMVIALLAMGAALLFNLSLDPFAGGGFHRFSSVGHGVIAAVHPIIEQIVVVRAGRIAGFGENESAPFTPTTSTVTKPDVLGGDQLQPTDTATTVRVADGEVLTTDGPFSETKEVLGG